MLTDDRGCWQELYHDGINREYFVPFLHQLARHTRVVDMNSQTDYRMLSEVRRLSLPSAGSVLVTSANTVATDSSTTSTRRSCTRSRMRRRRSSTRSTAICSRKTSLPTTATKEMRKMKCCACPS